MQRDLGYTVAAAALASTLWCCAGPTSREQPEETPVKTIEEVLAAHTDSLMDKPGVVGTAIGLCDGIPCIRVFLTDSSAAVPGAFPDTLEGYRLSLEVTGPIRPRRGGPA